jgi:hypothetical protein
MGQVEVLTGRESCLSLSVSPATTSVRRSAPGRDRGSSRSVLPSTHVQGPRPGRDNCLSPRHVFQNACEEQKKKCRRGDACGGRNHVGAACSAYRMLAYEPAHGAEICPLSATTPFLFNHPPRKVSGREGTDVHPDNSPQRLPLCSKQGDRGRRAGRDCRVIESNGRSDPSRPYKSVAHLAQARLATSKLRCGELSVFISVRLPDLSISINSTLSYRSSIKKSRSNTHVF